jgi:hypothetical protein
LIEKHIVGEFEREYKNAKHAKYGCEKNDVFAVTRSACPRTMHFLPSYLMYYYRQDVQDIRGGEETLGVPRYIIEKVSSKRKHWYVAKKCITDTGRVNAYL